MTQPDFDGLQRRVDHYRERRAAVPYRLRRAACDALENAGGRVRVAAGLLPATVLSLALLVAAAECPSIRIEPKE